MGGWLEPLCRHPIRHCGEGFLELVSGLRWGGQPRDYLQLGEPLQLSNKLHFMLLLPFTVHGFKGQAAMFVWQIFGTILSKVTG